MSHSLLRLPGSESQFVTLLGNCQSNLDIATDTDTLQPLVQSVTKSGQSSIFACNVGLHFKFEVKVIL